MHAMHAVAGGCLTAQFAKTSAAAHARPRSPDQSAVAFRILSKILSKILKQSAQSFDIPYPHTLKTVK